MFYDPGILEALGAAAAENTNQNHFGFDQSHSIQQLAQHLQQAQQQQQQQPQVKIPTVSFLPTRITVIAILAL
jgi:hypothetical protein